MSLFDLYFFDSIRRFESLDGLLPRFASSVLFSERARLRHSLARTQTENGDKKGQARCVSPRTFVVGKPLAILRGGDFPYIGEQCHYRGAIFFSRVKPYFEKLWQT